jgi:hypothetical protein
LLRAGRGMALPDQETVPAQDGVQPYQQQVRADAGDMAGAEDTALRAADRDDARALARVAQMLVQAGYLAGAERLCREAD